MPFMLANERCRDSHRTRQHWIQRITFTADTNAACSCSLVDTGTHTDAELHSLSGGIGNKIKVTH